LKEVVGEIRKGQLVTMFGVGSMIDLPHLSVLVRGLHQWSPGACKEIVEPRLLSAVRAKLPEVDKIRSTPEKNSDEPEFKKVDPSGVPVSVFPRWLRCPLCNAIGTANSGMFSLEFPPFQIDKIKYIHRGCPKQGTTAERNLPAAVPVRFLVTCKRGHIDEFPWFEFCHRGSPCPRQPKNPRQGRDYRPGLVLTDEGVTGEAAEVQVRCLECDAFRPLADAFGQNADLCLPGCAGNHLHLGTKEKCTETPEAILLGASNLYFPLTVSVLALPEKHMITDLDAIVKQHWDRMEKVTSIDKAESIIEFGGIKELEETTPEELFNALERARAGEPIKRLAELREEEYRLLASLDPSVESSRLAAERVADLGSTIKSYFDSIALVTRLTEFSALVGFTRVESAGDLSDFDSVDPDRLAPLMPGTTTWVPGAENKGEGVFLQLSEERLHTWERSSAVRRRMESLRIAFDAYRNERPWIKIDFPSARYIALHTLSHILLRELAITCGYSSTSLKERIYCRPSGDGVEPMAGILIYTASPDSEGTLGGLVALGRPKAFEPMLKSGLERSRVCSSDPICSHREIEKEAKLHGAACHSCGFLAETSCERANQFLDRAFLVDTLGASGLAFFGDLR
jgi:Domain of unknown function (DUF1998)